MTNISKMKFSNNEYPSIDEYVLCQITNFVELNGLNADFPPDPKAGYASTSVPRFSSEISFSD